MNKNFVIIGASGYIAPRHMKAIRDTGNNLIAVVDPYDGIGVIDRYFPKASYFKEFERFDRFIDLLQTEKNIKIDYTVICSPNYLHDSHIRFALRINSHAICEKPLVLNPWNIDRLQEYETNSKTKIYSILQLRYHQSIVNFKEKVDNELKDNPKKIFDITLTYITSRGKWYLFSWKGNHNKSGGIATNIGVHFFDMLSWIFGECIETTVHLKNNLTNSGMLKFKNANVSWFLSIDKNKLPKDLNPSNTTYRSLVADDYEIEFSDGFTDLHTKSYAEILEGRGFGLNDSRKSIEIVSEIRNLEPIGLKNKYHPFCKD